MDVTLTATTGRPTGSRPSKRLRVTGEIPGTLYGLGREPLTVSVEQRSLRQALTTDASLNAIITMKVDGTDELCIVKELQRHKVRNEVIHVDFLRVDPKAEILVDVPIVIEGEAREVLAEQGVVDQIHYVLQVWAKPDAIPNELLIDITDLAVGDTLLVSDLVLPEGARTEVDPEEVIITASVTRAEVEDEAEGEVAEGEAAAPAADEAAPAEGDES